uniref:Odorant binding protein 24 n=1 Tax=Dendroctonus adjunctus TaxID=77157 RepID=A0A7U3U815_9CUCU|nr:Odorant binding protein 24 [Dendroctonus adjunctus]
MVARCQFSLLPEDIGKLLQTNAKCQKKSGATQQEIMGTLRGTFSDSPELKKHLFCLGVKLDFISKDGVFQKELIRDKMAVIVPDESQLEDLLEKCLMETENAADSVYQSIRCFAKQNLLPQ